MKKFEIPVYYKSDLISSIKDLRKIHDPRKQDYSPTELNFGGLQVVLARHFGFCYGVENAIEIAYKAVDENPGRRVFLLSEMIHNPGVNDDLRSYGVGFLMDTEGNPYPGWDTLSGDDVVIIPAFGTTLEIELKLEKIGATKYLYNTTCPFVEKVWKKSATLGKDNFTVIIHGKYNHEETRATFSHTVNGAPAVIVRDLEETKLLADFIEQELPNEEFYKLFEGKYSDNFDPSVHLKKVGVVNQTTMLASETQEISEYLRDVMLKKYGNENIAQHYADTRDTLCYATNDNQRATYALASEDANLAIVVGGANSSNTTHIVEILEDRFPTFFISDENKIHDNGDILSYNIHKKTEELIRNFLNGDEKIKIVVTSGASCPDSVVERVIDKLLNLTNTTVTKEEAYNKLLEKFKNG